MARILVVDDEIDACRVLEEFLTAKGYEVLSAQDGPTAIRKVEEFKPHIVFLDIIMPGVGGIEVLHEIKRLDPQVAVIMVSVVTEPEKAKRTFDLGAYDYITKPVDLDYLEKVVIVKLLDLLT